MNKLAIYQENKMVLSSRDFLLDVLEQISLTEMDGYERTKQLRLFFSFQVEAFKMGIILSEFDKKENEKMILMRFKRLSVNELYYALQLERYGEHKDKTDHYNRFDTVFLAEVLEKYIKWKQKVRMDHNIPIGKTQEAEKVSEVEKKALIYNGVLEAYDHYKEHYLIMSGKGYVHELLVELDLISNDLDLEAAQEVLLLNISSKKATSLAEKRQINDVLRDIEKKGSGIVVNEAKRIAIGKYFRSVGRGTFIEILKKKL